MKLSKNFKADWELYSNNEWLDFLRTVDLIPNFDANGLTAKECFFYYDSTGKLKDCKEVELFNTILNRKRNLNMQIMMWVQGFKDCMEPVSYYMESFNGEVPAWVKKSFENQIKKKYGWDMEIDDIFK